jgi:hypothetical protein
MRKAPAGKVAFALGMTMLGAAIMALVSAVVSNQIRTGLADQITPCFVSAWSMGVGEVIRCVIPVLT